MENRETRLFKLNYSGEFDETVPENVLELFKPINIIILYIPKWKRMYVWVGDHATQALKNYIPNIRTRFSEKYPEYRVIRNITIESHSEPSEFFDALEDLGISKGELDEQISHQENKILPIINEIEKLKIKQKELEEEENFEEALNASKKIVELSHEINDSALEQEQSEKIRKYEEKLNLKELRAKIEQEALKIKKEYDHHISSDEIIQAHKLINNFKEKYMHEYPLDNLSLVMDLLRRDKRVWRDFQEKQEEYIQNLKDKNIKSEKLIENRDLGEAKLQLNKMQKLKERIIDQESQNYWNLKINELNYIISKEKFSQDISSLKESFQFDILKNRLNDLKAQSRKLNELEDLKEFRDLEKEIINLENNYDYNLKRLEDLVKLIEKNRENNHLRAALENSKQITSLAEHLNKKDIYEKYSELEQELVAIIEQKKNDQQLERKKLLKEAETLKDLIEIEEDVLPLTEEFKFSDIIEDLSDDISEMLNQVSGLLDEHRVEIKKEITNKALLKSKSGEVSELEQKIEVPEPEEEKEKEEVQLNVESVVSNPFDDVIEEAILTDLIPYNFEIDKVELNGELVDQLPDKSLTKEGLELNWRLENIPPKENVNVNYNLRRRVSRTIIFVLKGKVKVIKTHSKITKQDIEGLFEAELPFTNSYNDPITGLVVEDIVPLYYVHIIKKPEDYSPKDIKATNLGELIKWEIQKMEPGKIEYTYNLIELYKLQEIKIELRKLASQGISKIKEGKLQQALPIYETMIDQVRRYKN